MYNYYDVTEEQAKFFLGYIFGITGEVPPIKPNIIEVFEENINNDTTKTCYTVVFVEANVGGIQYVFYYNDLLDVFPISKEDSQNITTDWITKKQGHIFEDEQGRIGFTSNNNTSFLPKDKFTEILRRAYQNR